MSTVRNSVKIAMCGTKLIKCESVDKATTTFIKPSTTAIEKYMCKYIPNYKSSNQVQEAAKALKAVEAAKAYVK